MTSVVEPSLSDSESAYLTGGGKTLLRGRQQLPKLDRTVGNISLTTPPQGSLMSTDTLLLLQDLTPSSLIAGRACLNPVSENEDLQYKLATMQAMRYLAMQGGEGSRMAIKLNKQSPYETTGAFTTSRE